MGIEQEDAEQVDEYEVVLDEVEEGFRWGVVIVFAVCCLARSVTMMDDALLSGNQISPGDNLCMLAE